jgi:hypothetical protein
VFQVWLQKKHINRFYRDTQGAIFDRLKIKVFFYVNLETIYARSNEILDWEGVGNRQLLCFFKA